MRKLMYAQEKHVRVFIENFLRAVAVMNIEVYDGYAFKAKGLLGPARSDSHVRKQAKAHCLIRCSMMTRGANRCKAIGNLSFNYRLGDSQ
jgi:hypothetical protein